MGGQDGFSRDLLDYNTESNTLMAGLKYGQEKKLQLGIDLSWMQAEAALAPFDLSADDYVAITPPMSYDFSTSHLNSDIDNTRIDADLWGKIWFSSKWWLRLRYKRGSTRPLFWFRWVRDPIHILAQIIRALLERLGWPSPRDLVKGRTP